jgi:hypothetical protein
MFTDLVIKNELEEQIKKISEKLGNQIIFLEQKKDSLVSKEKSIHISKATRTNIENKQKKYHYFAEYLEEKDSMHHRRSGMNQVLMKLIKQNQKILIIGIEDLIIHEDKPLIIGRIKQNLKLAKKFKVPIIVASLATKPENLRSKEELKSFIKTLGYEDIAKEAVSFEFK